MTDTAQLYPIVTDPLGEWYRTVPWMLSGGKFEATYERMSTDGRKQLVQVQIAKRRFLGVLPLVEIEGQLRAADFLEQETSRHLPRRQHRKSRGRR